LRVRPISCSVCTGARRELALESAIAKLDRYDLLILDENRLCDEGSSGDQRTAGPDRGALRTTLAADHG